MSEVVKGKGAQVVDRDERYFLIVLVDIDPSVEEAFNDWYNEGHVPDVVRCSGFLRGQRAVAVDDEQSPRYAAIYEATSYEALDSPDTERIRGWGPATGKVTVRMKFKGRTTGPLWSRDEGGETRKAAELRAVFGASSVAGAMAAVELGRAHATRSANEPRLER